MCRVGWQPSAQAHLLVLLALADREIRAWARRSMPQDLRQEVPAPLALRVVEEVVRIVPLDDLPLSMKITQSATALAKPISCVTTSMVMPCCASSIITSSTSLIISGSSAEVGSSNSMILGVRHSARAIATRCCCPPESCSGNLAAWSAMRTRSSCCIALASASFLGSLPTHMGDSVRFSSTVRCGNRLNCWNTMPTLRRTRSMAFTSSPSSVPSTTSRPSWYSSSALTQRISVDLPEPEGPQMTMRSPGATFRSMSRSTWKSSPYHLLTFSKLMMVSGMGLSRQRCLLWFRRASTQRL
jgi:hypothetical protein